MEPRVKFAKVEFVFLLVVALIVALVGGGVYYYYKSNAKPDLLLKFSVTADRMAKDLEGKTAPLAFGQVWPFDSTQNLSVTVLGKRQVDDFVVVAVELRANAKVVPPEKDAKQKLPARVVLSGVGKLTYEWIGGDWYLVSVDSVSLHATPAEE